MARCTVSRLEPAPLSRPARAAAGGIVIDVAVAPLAKGAKVVGFQRPQPLGQRTQRGLSSEGMAKLADWLSAKNVLVKANMTRPARLLWPNVRRPCWTWVASMCC